MELTTYKVTFKETADEWIFQYRKEDGFIYQFTNLKGTRIASLLAKNQFPQTAVMMEEWRKFKGIINIELMLEDYSFEAFWDKYGLKHNKVKSEKAFNKLKLVEKIMCFSALPKYEAFLARTGQAKAQVVTWVNQRRFEDEY
ncbi:MAG TPA: hypothetical protein VKZ97_02650 [Flavobacteriaceae bacterium]|nr:hypothetical protein [Flavobacteriaceae bacterium]